MRLFLYNTMGRKVQEFLPLEEGRVGLYACGPTVYNYAHLGNLRTYVFEDLLRRVLEYGGYEVDHVMNITDVGHLTDDADGGEDKMVKTARDTGRAVSDIAKHYTEAFFCDTNELNIQPPRVSCAATEHIDDMIALVKRLETRGYTYFSGGNLYFDISRFPDYGKLALLDRQELKAGARIKVDRNKKNPRDFVLWFTNSKFENQAMQWDSPWGRGYPGWHIECSAMSMKYLGETFDIHCGGVDHIPIHHTNEIAQSEGATGGHWVNFWLHGEFLLLKQEKMAKSSGSFLTLGSLKKKGFEPLDYRYFCLGGHYRSQLVFTEESLAAAKTARKNLNDRILRLKAEGKALEPSALGGGAQAYLRRFEGHIAQDMGIPRALSELWGLLKDSHISPRERLGAACRMDRVFGLRLSEALPERQEFDPEIDGLVAERQRERREKNFARADEIRSELTSRGIMIKDTPQGTVWTRKP